MLTKGEVTRAIIGPGLVLDYSGSQPEGTAGNTPAGDTKAQHNLLAQVAGQLHLPISVNSRARSIEHDAEGILGSANEAGLEVIVGAHDILDLNDTSSALLMQRLYRAGARFFTAPAGFTPATTSVDRKNYRNAVLIGGSTSLEGWREQHRIGADLVLFPGANLRPNDLSTYWPLLHRQVPMGVSGPIVPEDLREASSSELSSHSTELQRAVQPYINSGALFILNGWPVKQGNLDESIEKCKLYLAAIQNARTAAPSPAREMYATIAYAGSLARVNAHLSDTSTPLRFREG